MSTSSESSKSKSNSSFKKLLKSIVYQKKTNQKIKTSPATIQTQSSDIIEKEQILPIPNTILPSSIQKLSKLNIKAILSQQTIDFEFDFDYYRVPDYWNFNQDMNLIEIDGCSLEYNCALNYIIDNGFNSTNGLNQVIKLERVQNKRLYIQYQALREEFTQKYSSPNELTLFHGTKQMSVDSICFKGFNRSYANICHYGKGIYFSNSALYSSKYAIDSTSTKCRMFICKVLVGSYELGIFNKLLPNQADSTVNNLDTPSIFVTYNDAQAYPEYLLTYI